MEEIVNILEFILGGLKVTLIVFCVTLLLSIPLGLLGAMLRRTRIKPLIWLIDAYTWIIRGTPLMLQILFIYFGLPIIFNIYWNDITSVLVTFVINYTAYLIEIFRGGMNTIRPGQFEACQALGLSSFQAYRYVILPQTMKKVLPSIANESITLIKDTALVTVIGVADVMFNTKLYVSQNVTLIPYVVAAVVYLFLSYFIVYIFKKLEKRYAFYN